MVHLSLNRPAEDFQRQIYSRGCAKRKKKNTAGLSSDREIQERVERKKENERRTSENPFSDPRIPLGFCGEASLSATPALVSAACRARTGVVHQSRKAERDREEAAPRRHERLSMRVHVRHVRATRDLPDCETQSKSFRAATRLPRFRLISARAMEQR